jgi:hypothetical protein
MSTDTRPAENRRRQFSFEAELDKLVALEVDALTARTAARAERGRSDADPPVVAESTYEPAGTGAPPPTAGGQPDGDDGRVIGLARASSGNGMLSFSPEEEAFIEGALGFLRQRPNADMIVEEIWSLTAGHGDADEVHFRTDSGEKDLDNSDVDGLPASDAETANPPESDKVVTRLRAVRNPSPGKPAAGESETDK